MSFDRVTEYVWLGSRIAGLDDLHRLRAQGVRACVDMKQEGADPWNFEAFLWLPTVDHEPPSLANLHLGIAFLRQCERHRVPVYVHCMAGVGRSSTLVLAYLCAGGVHSGESALRLLQSRRPVANPSRAQYAAALEAALSFGASEAAGAQGSGALR